LTVTRALAAIGLTYDNHVRVRHPLDILLNDVGLKAIAAKVKRPLKGLKVAPYYGCQIVRPYSTFDDQRNPTSMDRLLEACGAKMVHYSLKTRCCGGSQKGTLPEIGLDLIHYLLSEAHKYGAEAIATVCPLCQFNLESFQKESGDRHHPISIPVVYFSQLLALALGAPANKIGLQRSLVPIGSVLAEKEIAYA
jgi:heterodisulfide reductase subunit B